MDKAIPSATSTMPPEGDARVSLAQGKLGQAMLSASVFGLFGAAAGRALARLGEGKNAPLVGRKFSTVVMALFAGTVAFYSSLRSTAADAVCDARSEGKAGDAALHVEPQQNGTMALPQTQIQPLGSQHEGAVAPAVEALQR